MAIKISYPRINMYCLSYLQKSQDNIGSYDWLEYTLYIILKWCISIDWLVKTQPSFARSSNLSNWGGILWVAVIVKSWVNVLTWLLIRCSLLSDQREASLIVDPALDNDYTTHKFPSQSVNSLPAELGWLEQQGCHVRCLHGAVSLLVEGGKGFLVSGNVSVGRGHCNKIWQQLSKENWSYE